MMGTISVKAEETTNAPALEHENYDSTSKEYTAQAGSAGAGITGLSGGGFYDMDNTFVGDTLISQHIQTIVYVKVTMVSKSALLNGHGIYPLVKVWGYCEDTTPSFKYT